MEQIADPERRALLLFERMLDLDATDARRQRLLNQQPPEVRAAISRLEEAEEAASRRFATAFIDSVERGIEPQRPDRVGPYRLVSLQGAGGMGEVWRAERDDGLFEQVVAVKLIRPALLGEIAGARFIEERRLLARLEHPNIARILDGGVSDAGWPYLVMDFVDGEPIDAWTTRRDSSIDVRIGLLAQAAAAVQAAHAQLIAHADIKPDNLLVTADGSVRLVDFGIARLFVAGDADGLRPMTRAFASPERLAGALPSVADDVYALGTVLERITPANKRDRDLVAIIARARAEEAEDRYAAVVDLAADLLRWRQIRPVDARRPTLSYRLRLFLRRHRMVAIVSSAAILVMGTVASFAIANRIEARREQANNGQRVRDLLGITHYLLFDLNDRMARQPQSLALRTAIAAQAQAYLNRLSSLPDAGPATRLQAAEGLRRLAENQGRPSRPNLAMPVAAARNLREAGRLAQQVPGPAAALLTARIKVDQARLEILVDNDLVAGAHHLAQAFGALARSGPRARELSGDAVNTLSVLRGWQGDYALALRDARLAQRLPPPSDPRDAALLAASIQDSIGESLYYLGDHAGSEPPYRAQRIILENAALHWPRDAAVLRMLGRSGWALGATLADLKRSREALRYLSAGSDELSRLVAFDRADADARRLLNIVDNARADTLDDLGRTAEARALLARGVESRRLLWLETPGEPMRLRDYAIAVLALATMDGAHKRKAQACASYALADHLFMLIKASRHLTGQDQSYSYPLLKANQRQLCDGGTA